MLTTFNFEPDAHIERQANNRITVEGHLIRSDYETERSLDELLADEREESTDNEALNRVAELYQLSVEDVEDALFMIAQLQSSDRGTFLNAMQSETNRFTIMETIYCL